MKTKLVLKKHIKKRLIILLIIIIYILSIILFSPQIKKAIEIETNKCKSVYCLYPQLIDEDDDYFKNNA